ncbi:MAG: VOC family protein [Candidatus Woykebacteria bacterium]
MIRSLESVVLFSENAQNLAKFYEGKVGLEVGEEGEGEDGSKMFELKVGSGPSLYIMDHSEVTGKNQDPSRIIFNLEVDDIEKEAKRLDETGVKKTKDVYHMEGYGLISTFEDVDGNYFQLVQVKPND